MNGKVELIREKLQEAQAVVIGAGSGLSAAAGLTYGESGSGGISGILSANTG